MSKTKISSKGQVIIPANIREKYDLKKGTQLEWQPVNYDTILIRKVTPRKKMSGEEWVKATAGMFKGVWKDVDIVEYVRDQRDRGYD
jgi:AbrB family looped-hinge helix DNA binding protein